MNKGVIHAIYQMHKQSHVNPALEREVIVRLSTQFLKAGGLREKDIPRLKEVIRWVIAILLDSVRSGKSIPIVIPRGHSHYNGKRFGYRIVERVLEAFKAQNYLSIKVAPPSRYGGKASEVLASRRFRVAHKDELIHWVRHTSPTEYLELRLTDKDDFLDIRFTKPVPIDSVTQQWVDNLRAINDFNQTVPIFLFEDDQTIKTILCDSFVTFNETRYVRSFCRGRLDCGGRFYGTWWQLIPSQYRSSISIDGQPVVECDFSAMALRLFYARIGSQPPNDPYDLGLTATNMGETRKILKRFVLAITNDKDGKFRLKRKEYETLGIDHEGLVELLIQKHPKISQFFFSDSGVELQFLDSKIAEKIMLEGIRHGILILSVHDSFIAQQRHLTKLMDIMKDVYQNEVGWPAVIRQETPKRSPQMNLPPSRSRYARFFHLTYLGDEIGSGRLKPGPGGLADYAYSMQAPGGSDGQPLAVS